MLNSAEIGPENIVFLGFLAVANAAWFIVARSQGRKKQARLAAFLGTTAATLAFLAFSPLGPKLSKLGGLAIRHVASPVSLSLVVWVFILLFLWQANVFTRPEVAWMGINVFFWVLSLANGWPAVLRALADSETFAVTAMIVVSLFFVWYGIKQAVDNDRRRSAGLQPWEEALTEKVPTWPNLVYLELVCILFVLTIVSLWSLFFPAPLEAPANPAWTPNPAKAPWYFVGIQELLVYFDATLAGIVLPGIVIVGLILLPYLDTNPRGNGYYTLKERGWIVPFFVFGFMGVWWFLIVVGFYLRGPNWSFVVSTGELGGPPPVQTARSLSDVFWGLEGSMAAYQEAGPQEVTRRLPPFLRELPGLCLVGVYFVGLPVLFGQTVFRHERKRLGWGRFYLCAFFILSVAAIPLKIFVYNLSGIHFLLALPEYHLHF